MNTLHEPDTPSWLDRILKQVDETFTPIARDLQSAEAKFPGIQNVRQQHRQLKRTQQMQGALNFVIAAFGLAFAIVNSIFLSKVDDECRGYDTKERKFLFAASIIMTVFFGILTISSMYLLIVAFR